jgi:hypothetical protein
MTASFILIVLLIAATPLGASEASNPFSIDLGQPAALTEATRVLEEEVKLAARPQTYLLIDLVANQVVVKGRAVELYRIPITAWSAEFLELMTGRFSLTRRPHLARPRIDPSADAAQKPISLLDMPIRYDLAFHPTLTLEVVPPASEYPFRWALWQAGSWWRSLSRAATAPWSEPYQDEPRLRLTLSENNAQSFAWILVDKMALVVRRPTDK